MLKLKIKDPSGILPDVKLLAEEASRGLQVLIRRHLRAKDSSTSPRPGFRKSGYYGDAAEHVEAWSDGRRATVEIDKPGISLHYEGGTVYPKKKALAVPIDPSVAGIWPSEANGIATGDGYSIFWPKGSSHGFIKENETSKLLWLLLPKATLPADKSVLPTDEEMLNAAEAAIWSAAS